MFVRSSKFRHVFGNPARKEQCYEGIRVTKSAHDANFCAVNPKFLAVVVESAGGGAFLVLPLEKTGRIEINAPKVCGHRGPVTDIKWNPFNDHVIASASDDTTIKLWEIPDGGLRDNLSNWIVDLQGHSKRINYIEWHPTASDILLSAGADFQCMLWDVRLGNCIREISVHPDVIFSISWNRDGSLFATTCKDKLIRVVNPRNGEVIAKGEGHHGSKASKVVFLKFKNLLFTTGFSRTSERQYALWDTNDMSKPMRIEEIDSSSGLMIPFYDHDTNVVYLAGKGDGNIRYVEIVDSPPYVHYLNQYQSSTPQRGLGIMPKRGVDTSKCEVLRFYKLHTVKDLCEPISMIVPRKSEVFQADIFPPTASGKPSLSADEWLNGQNREPLLVSLKDGAVQTGTTVQYITDDKDSLRGRAAISANVNRVDNELISTRGQQGGQKGLGSYSREPVLSKETVSNREPPSLNQELFMNRDTLANGHSMAFTKKSKDVMQEPMVSSLNEFDSDRNNNRTNNNLSSTSQFYNMDDVTDFTKSSKTTYSSATPPARASVQRAATFHGNSPSGTVYSDNYGTPQRSTASSTNHLHLVRNSSLLSDGGDISDIPITPVVHPQKVVRRHRRRRRNDDSSSCSSMEDLDAHESAWTENPLYSQNKSPTGRRKNGRASHRQAQLIPPNVDLAPLNEVLNGTEFRSSSRPLSKSSGDLVSKLGHNTNGDLVSKSSGHLVTKTGSDLPMKSHGDLSRAAGDMVSKSGNDIASTGDLMSFTEVAYGRMDQNSQRSNTAMETGSVLVPKSQFRSEPDVAMYQGSRTDFLKSSETHTKQKAPLALAEDDTIFEDEPEGSRVMIDCISVEAPDDTLIKPSRLRASMNSRNRRVPPSENSSTSSTTPGTPLRRAGSLRETKSSASETTSPFHSGNLQQPTFPITSEPSAFHPVNRLQKPADVVISGRKVIPPSSVPPPRFIIPGSGRGAVLPNPYVFTVPADNARKMTVLGKTNSVPPDAGSQTVNTAKINSDLEQQSLVDLCKRQGEEILFLKQQLNERDAKIRLLENRLGDPVVVDSRYCSVGLAKTSV